MEVDGVPLPSLSLVRKKADDLRALDSRSLTTEEVDAMIAKRNKGKVDSVNLILKRNQLREDREAALAAGDEEEVRRIDRELQEVEDTKNGRPTARPESQMERIARLNAENRKRNVAEIRKAELEEKRAARLAAQLAAQKGETPNPFMRVKTVAKFRHEAVDTKKEKTPDTNGSQSESGTPLKQGTPNPQQPKQTNGVGILNSDKKGRRKGGVDDVIANMDIDIDI
jgi:RNA polymerase-associated protein RTF1